jgi:hypothetical protein
VARHVHANDRHWVYGLVDPRTRCICYIGCSWNPEKRFREHVGAGTNKRAQAWCQELLRLGVEPELILLGSAATRAAGVRLEKQWIAVAFVAFGSHLLNWRDRPDKGLWPMLKTAAKEIRLNRQGTK